MGLTAVLVRAAAARPRVLLLSMPGATDVRLAAERELRLRDFPLASTPAHADILLVAGPVSPALSEAVERLWQDVPAPRARVHVATTAEVAPALTASGVRLATQPGHASETHDHEGGRQDQEHGRGRHGNHAADDRAGHQEDADGSENNSDGPDGDHAVHGDGHERYGAHDDHGEDHGEHGGHGGMGMPAGLRMPKRGPDRDGLTLDRLHVPFGPLLPDWPVGLTLRLTLQGDVIQEAVVDPVTAAATGSSFWAWPWQRAAAGEPVSVGEAARRRAAAHLDSLGRLLAVAGWPAMAVTARRLRDDLVGGAAGRTIQGRLRRFARRVGRSRALYWLTCGIGSLSAADAEAAGVSGPAVRADGDVPARYRQWLTEVERDVDRLDDPTLLDSDGDEGPRGRRDSSAALVDLLPRLLEGTELAAARLIVASLDPDPDELAAQVPEVTGG